MVNSRLPLYKTGVVSLSFDQCIDLGNSLSISFNGNHSFTITSWVKIQAFCPSGTLVSKEDEFLLGLKGKYITAQMAGQISPVVGQQELELNRWHHITVNFASNGDRGGVMSLFIDGVPSGQATMSNVGIGDRGKHWKVGSGLNAAFWSVGLWSAVKNPSVDDVGMWKPPSEDSSGLVSYYSFAEYPARDTSLHSNPIHYVSGASQEIAASGVRIEDDAYCETLHDETVNPGGSGSDSYTIQSWFYAEKNTASKQVLISTGNFSQSNGVAIFLEYDSSSQSLQLKTQRGAPTDIVLTANQPIELNEWNNVAVTYDGSMLKIYLNGDEVGSASADAIDPLPESDVVIGASRDTGVDDVDYYFQGYVQNVVIWDVALSKDSIEQYMVSDPIQEERQTANYNFAVFPARNMVSGNPVALIGGAQIEMLYMHPDPQIIRESIRRALQIREGLKSPSEFPHTPLQRSRSTGEIKKVPPHIKKRVLQDLERTFPHTLGKAERRRLLDAFEADFEKGYQHGRTNPLEGSVVHRREGDHFVFYCHQQNLAYEVYRIHVDDADPCVIWLIEYIATAFFGLLTVLEVPVTLGCVNRAIDKLFKNHRLLLAVSTVVHEEISTNLIVSTVKIFYDEGALKSFLIAVFTEFSWWEFLFLIAQVLVALVEIMFPNPSTAVYVAYKTAQLGVTVGQLLSVYSDKPDGCYE